MKPFLLKLLPTTALLLFAIPLLGQTAKASAVKPTALRCEHLENPLGIDVLHPRLSWMMDDSRQGASQSAYRIMVGKDSLALTRKKGAYWDSGKISKSVNLINYQGQALAPFTKYFWAVELWDKDGKPSSAPVVASFEMGMMKMENWKGTWISDKNDIQKREAPYFRKSFKTSAKTIKSARAYLAAGGLYELYLNGKKVGNHRLDPMYTRFDKRNLYVSYDVTAQVKKGENAIGVILGNGWYNHQALAVWNFDKAAWRARPTFCLDLRITYEDGTTALITSDQDWKTSTGPIVLNNIYTAEHYDARLEQSGWNTVGFDDKNWKNVIARQAPSNQIVSQAMAPIRNVEEIPVKSINKINDTTYVFDLGRNISGVTKLKVDGPEGTVIRLKHGERLYKNGHVDLSNIDVYYRPKDNTDPFQTDIITLSGKGPLEFMPRFNYKGFQYVEVSSNKPIQLLKESITGYFMHSDVSATGKISSSNPLIDRLWWATNNSYLSNLMGYPTDCPQREKNGWTGDGHFAVETGLFNFDGITVYEKWLADHRDEQQPNGVLPDIIPTGGWGYGTANGTDWTSTIAIIPWNIYLFYGDSQSLADSYNSIKKYVDYLESISPTGITTFGRGDWVPVKSESSLAYTSSTYYYVDAVILAKAARLFGKSADEKYYSTLAEKIKKAINDKYFKPESQIYASGTQTELSMALQWGLVPEALKAKVAANLAKRVAADGMHLDVGVLGAKAILNALSDNGQAETAYKLAAQDTYPSWGWWIVNGATTLYENWDINAPRDISLNHMMFGEIGAWLFKGLGGIHPDEAQPGFKNIQLRPNFVSGLDHFEAEHDGPYGKISSAWKRDGKKVIYEVNIPPNSSATITFPLEENQKVMQGGKTLRAFVTVKAGQHRFEIN
ncbi:glycoside hydrolase family 78 protein [Pedobacter gandavensis]|uniref:alpha-L-rhamnosidase n=1 Tax=Pedobacter gandavensis TaxID=2679963 RepID=A0ABR6EQY0_9SPHI|nr:glycoside hydrolase family 78 protein [Pedobacter gandavensis]MBB2147632.1 Bacterial alpha-L-rhamnosidase [Pedobacter gandavensis]